MQDFVSRIRRFLVSSIANSDRDTLVEPALQGRATTEDAAYCYLLIVGRPAENEAVLQDQVGKPFDELIDAFFGSDEFRQDTRAHLTAKRALGLFAHDPDADMLDWASRRFAEGGVDSQRLREIQDMPLLLSFCLKQPRVGAIVDRRLGDGEAVRLSEAAGKLAMPRLAAITTAADVRNCYRLFLQREPESDGVAVARPGSPLVETVRTFVESPEFADRVAYPAMDGYFSGSRLSDEVRAWAGSALRLDQAAALPFPSLVAATLTQPAITHGLAAAKLNWPIAEVVRGLQFIAGAGRRSAVRLDKRLQETCHGMHVVANSGMKIAKDRHGIRFTDADPWVVLRPSTPVANGDLLAVRFRVTLDGQPTQGHLYLDFGQGYNSRDSLALSPDHAGFQHLIIVAPNKIAAMRWDPAACSGDAVISLIEAKALSAEDYLASHPDFVVKDSAAAMLRRIATGDAEDPLGIALAKLLSPVVGTDYSNWILQNEAHGPTGRAKLEMRYAQLTERPLISVIVPTYNTPPVALNQMVESVRSQVYQEWELCIADDASTRPGHRALLAKLAASDDRIRIVQREVNGHICEASNSALGIARGEWLALLDHDDELAPNALLEIAIRAEAVPESALIYSDEDKIDEQGRRFEPYFKPGFSPEMLFAQNYFNHLTAMRRALVEEVGGWRRGFEGSQDHDLILRIVERIEPRQIQHVPVVLYHWRAIAGSTALENNAKDYVLSSGEAAVRDHLKRTKQDAEVETMKGVHHYRVRYALPKKQPLVSLIIPTRDQKDVLKIAIESIREKSSYSNYEILIVDNGSVEKSTKNYFKTLHSDDRIRIESYPGAFNFSAINNFGARLAGGSVIGLVNNDIEVITPDWIEEMASWAIQKEIGCVGAKLYYSNGTIQHAGVIVGLGGIAGHSHKHSHRDSPGYFNRLRIHQNLSAVTAACLMVRREVFDEVGGLDEELAVAFNDVDFCLRVREKGYRNVFTPFAELYHHESVSRGAEDNPEKIARFGREINFMRERWREKLHADPYYSPNLTYNREDFGINVRVT